MHNNFLREEDSYCDNTFVVLWPIVAFPSSRHSFTNTAENTAKMSYTIPGFLEEGVEPILESRSQVGSVYP